MLREKLKNNPLTAIFVAIFVDFFAFGMIIPVIPALFSANSTTIFDLSVPAEQRTFLYGIMLGLYGLSSFITAPLLGAWSDRAGRKKVLTLTNTANGISYLIFAVGISLKSVEIIFVSRILAGLFGSSVFIIQSAIADMSSHERKAANFGIVGIAFGLGLIFGAASGGLLTDKTLVPWFGQSVPFICAAVINGINLLFVVFLLPETLTQRNHRKINLFSGVENITRAFSHPSLRLVFIVIFILTLGFAFYIQFLPVWLTSRFAFGERDTGFFFAFIGISAAITQGLVLRYVTKWVSPAKLLLVTLPMFALSYLGFLLVQNPAGLLIAQPLLVLFQSTSFPSTLSLISNHAGSTIQGETIGINQSLQSLANALSSFAAAWIVSMKNDFIMVFGAVCGILAWLLYLWYYFGTKKNEIHANP